MKQETRPDPQNSHAKLTIKLIRGNNKVNPSLD